MLTFVGLGLYDERSITVEGREAVAAADRVFAEFYTSRLAGATVADLEAYHGVDVEVRDRAGVEQHPEPMLEKGPTKDRSTETPSPITAGPRITLSRMTALSGTTTRPVTEESP